ncbi:MAG TPA: MEDS domain-containing protein [Candidatus Limnocylindria bacterium]|nr:MEDS domain-containing protein [Candidatus Limnocylindria bacterium]
MKDEATRPAMPADLGASERGHEVAYYEHSQFLIDRVGEFLAPGLTAGEAVVVVATPKHADLIEHELIRRGIDLDRARRDGYFVSLDAVQTLTQIMTDGRPDPVLFASVVGGAIERARAQAKAPIVRAFGEMVAVLWARGRPDAALALEDVWNDLLGHHPFSLLCGYPQTGLKPGEAQEVSARHTSTRAQAKGRLSA